MFYSLKCKMYSCPYLTNASENFQCLTVCNVPDTLLLSLPLLFHHHFLSHTLHIMCVCACSLLHAFLRYEPAWKLLEHLLVTPVAINNISTIMINMLFVLCFFKYNKKYHNGTDTIHYKMLWFTLFLSFILLYTE